MKHAVKLFFLIWVTMLASCNADGQSQAVESDVTTNDDEMALKEKPFVQAYPDDETLDILLQGSSDEKSQGESKKLDFLWGFVTARKRYRGDDGSYDYENMLADLWQTSLSQGIPVAKGDEHKLKKYFKSKLGSRYDDYQTTKVLHEADSVWSIYISGKFNRRKTSWSSPADTPFTKEMGYSSNK